MVGGTEEAFIKTEVLSIIGIDWTRHWKCYYNSCYLCG